MITTMFTETVGRLLWADRGCYKCIEGCRPGNSLSFRLDLAEGEKDPERWWLEMLVVRLAW